MFYTRGFKLRPTVRMWPSRAHNAAHDELINGDASQRARAFRSFVSRSPNKVAETHHPSYTNVARKRTPHHTANGSDRLISRTKQTTLPVQSVSVLFRPEHTLHRVHCENTPVTDQYSTYTGSDLRGWINMVAAPFYPPTTPCSMDFVAWIVNVCANVS